MQSDNVIDFASHRMVRAARAAYVTAVAERIPFARLPIIGPWAFVDACIDLIDAFLQASMHIPGMADADYFLGEGPLSTLFQLDVFLPETAAASLRRHVLCSGVFSVKADSRFA